MHLTTHFSFLFVTAFFLYCFPGVAAVPTKRQPRSVTFPIRSLHPRRVPRDIDPGTVRVSFVMGIVARVDATLNFTVFTTAYQSRRA